ncbi:MULTISPECIES: hypothetical protein [Clostridium]|uniref:Uncharacterized protein n=1 Tax=Clostridium senegalense TaxID=1465809 RepID=A0A6M0GZW2_9CLOT|nr:MULTISPECIES: hypothetical protein [Clostridium]NEU03363.1 hypothetical protein [Clostridium senegalense]
MNYDEYDLIPLQNINNMRLSEEMEEFMALYSMRGLINFEKNKFIGFLTPMPAVIEENEFVKHSLIESKNEHKFEYIKEKYDDLKINKTINRIEKNNPEIIKFLLSTGLPYRQSIKIVEKIVKLAMLYR